MTKLELLKNATTFVVSIGVGKIIGDAVDNLVTTETIPQKLVVFAGKAGITAAIQPVVKVAVDAKIDTAAAWIAKNVTK